jgi:hypothetical protein
MPNIIETFIGTLEAGTPERAKVILFGKPGPPAAKVANKYASITEGAKLRDAVAKSTVPAADEAIRYARSVVSGRGGGALLRKRPELAGAIVHEVYLRVGAEALKTKEPLEEKTIRAAVAEVYSELEPAYYKAYVVEILDKTGATLAAGDKAKAADLLRSRRVSIDSPRFEREVFAALKAVKTEKAFSKFFDEPSVAGGDSLATELGPKLTPERRRRAISALERLGIEPELQDDREDWARVALGLVGEDGASRDISLAAYAPDVGIDFERELDFPEFETADVTGLIAENIRTCADLYYVHMFDRLGVYRVVDAISVRFFDRLNLGLGDTARRLYVYIKRRGDRIPAEDRRRITDRIFEVDGDGRAPFKLLMGQLVESLIDYTRVRNAGELLLNPDRRTYDGSPAASRSAVLRSIENIQHYLTRAGGGMSVFLSREAGAQLIDAFEILQSPELQSYFGGEFGSGMWSIIEEVGQELEGGPLPPADRMRTLAVHGRRIMRWLADNTDNVGGISDVDLDELSMHVQAWLAAYRKPAIEEPEWLDDDLYQEEEDEGPAAEAIEDAMAEAREPDVLEVG